MSKEALEKYDRQLSAAGKRAAACQKTRLFDEAQDAGLALLPWPARGRVLLVETSLSPLRRFCAARGAELTIVHLHEDDELLGRRLFGDITAEFQHFDGNAKLPLASESFDLVLVSDGQTLTPLHWDELLRLLKPAGTIYGNDFAPHGMLQRTAAGRWWMRLGTERQQRLTPVTALLESRGLAVKHFYPWPSHRNLKVLLHDKPDWSTPARLMEGGGWRAAADRLLKIFYTLPGTRRFLPAQLIVAGRAGVRDVAPASLLASLLAAQGETQIDPPELRVSSTKTLLARGRDRFHKVPLTLEAQKRLEAERVALVQLRRDYPQLAELAWLEPSFGEHRGLIIQSSPLLGKTPSAADRDAFAAIYLKRVERLQELGIASVTGRFETAIEFCNAVVPDADAILVRINDLLRQKWSLAPTHGDFHPENICRDAGGTLKLIDWDRFSPRNLWHLDAIHYWLRRRMATQHCAWQRVVESVLNESRLAGTLRVTVGDGIWELDAAMLILYILDRLQKDLTGVPHFVYLGEPWRTQMETTLNVVARLSR